MFFWVYDIHNWLFCAIVVGACVAFSLGGLLLLRPWVRRTLGSGHDHNDFVNYFLSAAGVFYGITLGLIAVGTWQTFSDTDNRISKEASELAALYRDVGTLPEPDRSDLRALLREYTDYVIDTGWPMQRRGEIPSGGNQILDRFQARFATIEPRTEMQKILVTEAFGQYNQVLDARRLRLLATTSGMPGTLWIVVFAGAALTMSFTWFFSSDNLKTHALLVTLMAVLIGLLIFMTAAMDYPFRGEFSVGPDAFENVRNQFMRQ